MIETLGHCREPRIGKCSGGRSGMEATLGLSPAFYTCVFSHAPWSVLAEWRLRLTKSTMPNI